MDLAHPQQQAARPGEVAQRGGEHAASSRRRAAYGWLTALECLELGVREWRVLLDAGAVPRTVKAAAVKARRQDHLPVVAIANEILALWDRRQIVQTLVEGDLGPTV